MSTQSSTIVQCVWNFGCNVLRDDGISYGDYVEQLTYLIFRKAQNRIQNPARLRRLIDLIDSENWSGLNVGIKSEIYEGLLEKNAQVRNPVDADR